MTSKLPINLENLLRQRQVEGERIEYKAGWNPDAIYLRQRRSVLQPRVARQALPWDTSPHTIQPQRGCVPCAAALAHSDGTALRFDMFRHVPQGRPHCIQPTLGWRTESRWDRNAQNGVSKTTIRARLDEKVDELDLTEGRSTGISKIIKAMTANGSPAPEFETDDDRSYFLIRLPVHEKAAAWTAEVTSTEHAAAHVNDHVTAHVGRLLAALDGEMSRSDLMAALEIKHRVHFADTYLRPALKCGLVEMTHPDKPKSVLQRYRLTDVGRRWSATHPSP